MVRCLCVAVMVSVNMLSACSLLFSDAKPGGTSDAGVIDAGTDVPDAFTDVPDAFTPFARCGEELLSTIGLFSVDGDDENLSVVNNRATGRAPGTYRADATDIGPTIVSEDSICGESVKLGPTATYAEFPPQGFLDARSVDFWFRPEMKIGTSQLQGLLTKDKLLYEVSAFGIYLVKNDDGGNQVLAQMSQGAAADDRFVSCSQAAQPVLSGVWHHLAVSFSASGMGMEVYLDGTPLSGTLLAVETGVQEVSTMNCIPGQASVASMSVPDNEHPWLWGAGKTTLPLPGADEPLEKASDFQGQLDELRFRSVPMTAQQAMDTYKERTGTPAR